MPALSLKTKMSLVVSLFVTVLISILALFALWYFEGELKNTISKQQFTMVTAMAEEIDSKLLNAQRELVAVAGSAPSNLAGNPLEALKFLDTQAGMRTVFDSGISIFSPTGTLKAISPGEPQMQGRDYSFRDYLKNTIATGRPQISMPFFSTRSHHHPVIMFTAPIFDAKGEMTGILAGALDLMRDNFLGKLATVKLGDKGYLYLYSTDRTLIVHPDRTRILRRDVPLGVNRLFDRAIEGFEGTGETVTSRGLHTVSSFKHLKSTNWILAANYPQAEAYAPIYRAKWYLLAAAVMALILSNIFVWWFMRHLTAPLLLFTSHVKGLTSIGNEPKPFRIMSRDEIGTLTQAFNEMLAELDEQKKTIRMQKEFSENLLLNSAVPTFVLDSRHRVIIWNKACEELTGMKASEILGTANQWKAFYRKERPILADIVINGNIGDLPKYYDSYNDSPFIPDGLQAEGWCSTANNRERYAFFDAAPVRNAEGEIVAVIETVQDITERKRAEEELEFKNVILSTQQETSIDGILLVDESDTIISYNRRFVDLWEIPPELVEAKDDTPVLQLVTTKVVDREGFVARVKYLYEHREEKSREEILLKDGRVFDRYSAPVRGDDGKYYGRVWYFHDITERRRMQDELLKAQKLESLGLLAGGIAHDFNNILTGIVGNLSIARLQIDPSHKIVKRLELCEKAAMQASELTRQLLTFARGGEPVKKLINPASLIRETVSFALRGANISSIIDIQDNLWSLEVDESQLNQVLNNLLLNASQAMAAGGEVTVRAANETLLHGNPHHLPPGDYITIAVEDRGCGIPQEDLVRIFDPYFTSKAKGSGLGLASVYSIVKRHGGAVEVSSTMGVGTSFTIHLPAIHDRQPEDAGTKESVELSGSGRVLVMDDEDFIRDVATGILHFMGYAVDSCADGREAVERFRAAWENNVPFSAVILDLTIPGGMGGQEAAARILEIDPDAVLIVSSGYSSDPVIANFRQYGFSGVVSKPFDAEGLARELNRLIPKRSCM
ncbi:MAG: ATP-binding protein [Geobacteraceae bacterium]